MTPNRLGRGAEADRSVDDKHASRLAMLLHRT